MGDAVDLCPETLSDYQQMEKKIEPDKCPCPGFANSINL